MKYGGIVVGSGTCVQSIWNDGRALDMMQGSGVTLEKLWSIQWLVAWWWVMANGNDGWDYGAVYCHHHYQS